MLNDCLALQAYESYAVRYLWKNLPYAAKDFEHIGRVAEYMARSDLSYKHGIGTLEGRRMTYAKFAVQHIKDILRRKRRDTTTYSLDLIQERNNDRGESCGANLSYLELGPAELAELREIKEFILGDTLSSIESVALIEYFLEKTPMLDIAKKFQVTRMAVWLAIERGLEKVRRKYGEKDGD